VIDFILCEIDGRKERPNIRPHVNGFKRSIVRKEDGTGFVTRGVIKQTSSTSLVISELPVGTGMIRKFSSAEEIVEAFFPVRLEMYCRRKRNMENVAEFETTLLQNKAKFIEYVTDGKIDLVQGRLAKADLVRVLSNQGFMKQLMYRT